MERDEAMNPFMEVRKRFPEASEEEFAEAMDEFFQRRDDERANSGPPSPDRLERWWNLVTDPEHTESEKSQIATAWMMSEPFPPDGWPDE
jgi:hypothetical protein